MRQINNNFLQFNRGSQDLSLMNSDKLYFDNPVLWADTYSQKQKTMFTPVVFTLCDYQFKFTVILKNALCGAIKAMRFLDEYANLLQEYISPEDYDAAMEHFDEIAEAHCRVLRHMSPEQIACEAKIVLDAVGEGLGSDELADILSLDTLSVEKALSKYSKK